MSTKHLAGEPPVAFELRQSARARRMTLRVSGIDRKVTLTVPRGVPEREALSFAQSKEAWIRDHLSRQDVPTPVALGSVLPVEGRMVRIVEGAGRRVVLSGDVLAVPGRADAVARRVGAFVRESARSRCAQAADTYAQRLGRSYSSLALRDTRSRWGSCTNRGRLMLSWRLFLAPREVLEYVVAHEVAHLAEMNHSQAFWDTVERIHGPYAAPRKWLRENGASLHRYRFRD